MASTHAEHPGHVPVAGIYCVIELGLGLWSGSVALVSDAFHTFSAVGGVLIALLAQRLSKRPAPAEHTFGRGRAEMIGALFNSLSLAIMALYVLDGRHAPAHVPVDLGDALRGNRRHCHRGDRLLAARRASEGQPEHHGRLLAHRPDIRRQPDHHRLSADRPLHALVLDLAAGTSRNTLRRLLVWKAVWTLSTSTPPCSPSGALFPHRPGRPSNGRRGPLVRSRTEGGELGLSMPTNIALGS
jgi:hypothetical protein